MIKGRLPRHRDGSTLGKGVEHGGVFTHSARNFTSRDKVHRASTALRPVSACGLDFSRVLVTHDAVRVDCERCRSAMDRRTA